ncbi:SAM-dependent methyltransferase [Amycolatopsis vancoresmycina]|uniref:SAM-dependent methyltransferase n=1 Tax=Amycolatopsis vancoresmycina TaxID=208444 RepID=UPI00039A3416|nr:class I SAM-dependent methyltransferase [Amycolatopsis vancoresmycina]
MSELSWTPPEVAEFYDGSSPMADKYYSGYQHLGYWYDDSDEATLEEASRRLTRKIVDTLGLRRDQHLLDAGCGLGAPAIHIAGEYGARVTGVTISPVEAARAQARADESGLSELVRFEVGDYHGLTHPENHFDAVVAIESLFNAFDLGKALLEFHRVLRPGGCVAFSEMIKTTKASQAKKPFPQAREPMTAEAWVQEFESAGFVVEEQIQCGRRVYVNSGRRYLEHHDEMSGRLSEEFGAELTDEIRTGMQAGFHLGPEDVSYLILCARKP